METLDKKALAEAQDGYSIRYFKNGDWSVEDRWGRDWVSEFRRHDGITATATFHENKN